MDTAFADDGAVVSLSAVSAASGRALIAVVETRGAAASRPPVIVIDDGRTGMICEGPGWFDALVALVDDAALRRRMGEAVRRDVLAAYGPDRCVAIWDDLIRQLPAVRHRRAYEVAPPAAGATIRLCGALTMEMARRSYRHWARRVVSPRRRG